MASLRLHDYLLSIPPSTEAFKHSGWDSRLLTSSTVTLYFWVELRSERRPGTRQKTSMPWGGVVGSCFNSSGSGVESGGKIQVICTCIVLVTMKSLKASPLHARHVLLQHTAPCYACLSVRVVIELPSNQPLFF